MAFDRPLMSIGNQPAYVSDLVIATFSKVTVVHQLLTTYTYTSYRRMRTQLLLTLIYAHISLVLIRARICTLHGHITPDKSVLIAISVYLFRHRRIQLLMPLYRYDNWQDIAIRDIAHGETGMFIALLLAPIRFLSRGKELVTKYSGAMTGLEPATLGFIAATLPAELHGELLFIHSSDCL